MAQKIRIVEKLNGNPHLMVAGSPSLAVRMYSIHDVQRLEKEQSDSNDQAVDKEGADGLKHFRDSYENSIVFFMLPSHHQRDQLSRRESFLHLAQQTNVRMLIVANSSEAISAMCSVVKNLAPEKREKKREFYAKMAAEQYYIPASNVKGGIEPTQETIANFAKTAMNNWAERMEIQRGDINVALDMLGSIANVATATDSDLDNIPITAATKNTIRLFFGGIACDCVENEKQRVDDKSDSMFGGIDDAELLNIPDPSPTENLGQEVMYAANESYEFDVPSGYELSSFQSQAREFYTPINPSFAQRRRYNQGQDYQQSNYAHHYDYPSNDMEMNFNSGNYPSANDYHQRGYNDDYSRSVRQYTNQFM